MNFYNYSQSQILIHSVAVISQQQFVYRSFFIWLPCIRTLQKLYLDKTIIDCWFVLKSFVQFQFPRGVLATSKIAWFSITTYSRCFFLYEKFLSSTQAFYWWQELSELFFTLIESSFCFLSDWWEPGTCSKRRNHWCLVVLSSTGSSPAIFCPHTYYFNLMMTGLKCNKVN